MRKRLPLWLSADPQLLSLFLGGWGEGLRLGDKSLLLMRKGKHSWRTNMQFISCIEFIMGECARNLLQGLSRGKGERVPCGGHETKGRT